MHRSKTLFRAILLALATTPTLALAAPAPAPDSCAAPAQEFAPGVISTSDAFESRLAFSPSRNTIFWSVTYEPSAPGSSVVSTILTSDRSAGGGWTAPSIASFSGVYSDGDAFITPYGDRIFFNSSRPGGMAPGSPLNDIWITTRTASGWSVPVNAGPNVNSVANELYPSVDIYGNLYFSSDRDGGQFDLYRARRLPNGEFAAAEKVPGQPNHPNRWEFNPEISPDGRTLLFATYGRPDSYGDVDIFVSHLESNGNFGRPMNIGPCVNTVAPEFHPTVLWDRNEFYFVRVGATTDFFTTPLNLP
jgi:Tol biopolymer transport system component